MHYGGIFDNLLNNYEGQKTWNVKSPPQVISEIEFCDSFSYERRASPLQSLLF